MNEFTQLGYVWEFNRKTQEYRAARTDKKGSERIKGAPMLWNKVTDCFRKYGVWFSDGKDLDEYLAKKDNERIDEEVNRRLEEQGKGKDKSSGSKGKGWENSDSWWNSDDSCWYENTGYENTWWEAQEDQWQQPHWTPKGKKSGKDKKGKAKWTQ